MPSLASLIISCPAAQISICVSTPAPPSLPAKKPPMSLVVTALAAVIRSAMVFGGSTPALLNTDLR